MATGKMGNKPIRFYSTFFHPKDADQYTYVWVPDSEDFSYYLSYYQRYGSSGVEVERRLLKHLPPSVSDITPFDFPPVPARFSDDPRPIVLYAQSDTLADSSARIYRALSSDIPLLLFYPAYKDEGAAAFFSEAQLPALRFSIKNLKNAKPRLLVLFNDWAKEAQWVIAIGRRFKVPTVCIQESMTDFGGKVGRMRHADHVFVQGIQSVLDLKRKHYYLTGNPRYRIRRPAVSQAPPTRPLKALVNCNFTYGIHEEVRDAWLEDVIDVLDKYKIDFFISQHPRDTGDLRQYGEKVIASRSASITEQIAKTDVIITRFSSLIHEGILQGKKVIYYNPHGEKMRYAFRFNHHFLFYCGNKKQLTEALQTIQQQPKVYDNVPYCIQHCVPYYTAVTDNLKRIFTEERFAPSPLTFKDTIRMLLYAPPILKVRDFLRQRIKQWKAFSR